jgi:hypothetical protein
MDLRPVEHIQLCPLNRRESAYIGRGDVRGAGAWNGCSSAPFFSSLSGSAQFPGNHYFLCQANRKVSAKSSINRDVSQRDGRLTEPHWVGKHCTAPESYFLRVNSPARPTFPSTGRVPRMLPAHIHIRLDQRPPPCLTPGKLRRHVQISRSTRCSTNPNPVDSPTFCVLCS